jgi:hypothetical protein
MQQILLHSSFILRDWRHAPPADGKMTNHGRRWTKISSARILILQSHPSLLRRRTSALHIADKIPRSKAARVVANEFLMVDIMVVSSGPEG